MGNEQLLNFLCLNIALCCQALMSCHSLQGSDGVDLEMNLNGSNSRRDDDDDDMDDIVSRSSI